MITPRTPGTPTWLDFWCSDIDATASFCQTVLGWTSEPGDPAFGGWRSGQAEGKTVTGFGPALPGSRTDLQALYLAVEDVKESFNVACGLGATPAMPPEHQVMTIPGSGIMSTLRDPQGNLFSLWQAAPNPGFEVTDVPGAPTWHELRTTDAAAARTFYAQLFGLTFSDPMPSDGLGSNDYRIAVLPDGDGVFGLTGLGEGQEPGWLSYYWTDDLDASHAKVEAAGGTTDVAPHPFTYGRCADYRTPGGARFGLFEPSREN